MSAKNLSDRKIAATKVVAGEKLLSDGENLYLRVRPNARQWLFIYRSPNDPQGPRKKLALGAYPTVSLSQARDLADKERVLLAHGTDPQQHRRQKKFELQAASKAAELMPETIHDLFKRWIKTVGAPRTGRKDGGLSIQRAFDKDVLPKIGELPLKMVRRAHIMDLLDSVIDRGANRMAGILLADMRQMFRYGVMREYLIADPTVAISKAAIGGLSQERERVLEAAEIKTLARQAPLTLQESGVCAIWIMLSTLCRVGEITRAKIADIDLENRIWRIPAEHAKNGRAHDIYLSNFAVFHFERLLSIHEEDGSQWVMPARHTDNHVCPKSLTKQIGDRQRGDVKAMKRRSPETTALILEGGKWTPHDLRRTGATMMGEIGTRPDVIEKCLNHVEQNRLVRTYQRQALRDEMRQAWCQLGEELEQLLGTTFSNVDSKPSATQPDSVEKAPKGGIRAI